MAQLPTVEDVAQLANVSRQTVSNVLNSPGIVKPATRTRVEAAIIHLGYRQNASAKRLRTRKSGTLGIRLDPLVNGISGSVLDRFLHALTASADSRGMRVLLYTAADPGAEIDQMKRLRDGADVDAFVLTSTFHGDSRTEWLIGHGIPFVTFGRPWGIDDMNDPQHLWVDVDGAAGVAAATQHLITQGAQRIHYLGWPSPSGTGDDRRRGWADVMRQNFGLDDTALADLEMVSVDDVSEATAATSAQLRRHPDAEALVCVSDSLALGATLAATSAGREDLKIIGFDNTPVAEAIGFSSVEQPLVEVAAAALELLMGTTGNDVVGREPTPGEAHRLIEPRLVLRQATTSSHTTTSARIATSRQHHTRGTK